MKRRRRRHAELYRRGEFWLAWDRRSDGVLRSPCPAIFWYDPRKRRTRSVSSGTQDVNGAKAKLDAFYLERSTGQTVCPTCHRPWDGSAGYLLTNAIADYLADHAGQTASETAIRSRLAHVVAYLKARHLTDVICDEVDERWVGKYRTWLEKQPIVSPKGEARPRALSTVENSIIQLQAAINDAYRRRNTVHPAAFKPQPVKELNNSPQHRSDVAELAEMFRYCVDPKAESPAWRERSLKSRAALHRFLIVSVATWARPDASYDVSTAAAHRQWNSKARILSLNPKGRRQTKKRRAIVRVAWQAALHLDAAPKSHFVGVKSVRSAWDSMAAELGLPDEGEAGTKLIRRSMAKLARDRRVPREEVELMLGHRLIAAVTDIYAPFDPDYLGQAVAVTEAIIHEIEQLCPGAFALRGEP